MNTNPDTTAGANRVEFEEAMRAHFCGTFHRIGDTYTSPGLGAAWIGWQARATLAPTLAADVKRGLGAIQNQMACVADEKADEGVIDEALDIRAALRWLSAAAD